MVKPADPRECDDLGVVHRLDDSRYWRVLLESKMRAVRVEVADVQVDHSAKPTLVDGDQVVETVTPESTYPSLRKRILPRRPERRRDLRQPESVNSIFEIAAVDLVAIAEQITTGCLERTRLDDLLCRPLGGGMTRHVEMKDSPPIHAQDEEHVDDLESDGWHHREVDGE